MTRIVPYYVEIVETQKQVDIEKALRDKGFAFYVGPDEKFDALEELEAAIEGK